MPCQLPSCLIWNATTKTFLSTDVIPASDRGFRYGMSVFETILIIQGQPVFLTAHLASLATAINHTGLDLPPDALELLPDTLQNLPSEFDGVARIYLTAGDGAPTDPPSTGRLLILLQPRDLPILSTTTQGLSILSSPTPYNAAFGGLKTGNYWQNIYQLQTAQTQGADEVVLFNSAQHLVSSAMANLFIVRDNRLFTPALSTGARNGVIRQWVLTQRPTEESLLTATDLLAADEVFLTSSWLGIAPIATIDNHSLTSCAFANSLAIDYRNNLPSTRRRQFS